MTAKPSVGKTAVKREGASALYCLLRFAREADPLDLFKQIAAMPHVLDCRAVRDAFDLLVLLSGITEKEATTAFTKLGQIASYQILPVEQTSKGKANPELPMNELGLCSLVQVFALIEVEPEARAGVFKALSGHPAIATVSLTSGGVDLVASLYGENYNAISASLREALKPLPGILRTHILKAFDLDAAHGFPRINGNVWRYQGEAGQLIPLLQSAQESYGYIPPIAVKYISGVTGRPESELYGVITFYKQFRLRPVGKYLVRLCDGTACHVNNAKMLREVLVDELKLTNEDTTPDGLFTLVPVACLGCCSLAPAMMVNDMTHGRLTPQTIRSIIRNYRRAGQAEKQAQEVAQ